MQCGAIRHSRQRESIKSYLAGTVTHPTADEVHARVRGDIPNISLGTVYRNLTMLWKSGELLKLHDTEGTEHFDADTSAHYHFVCTCCNRISDIKGSISGIEKMLDCGENDVTSHMLYLYGTCAACKGKQNEARQNEA